MSQVPGSQGSQAPQVSEEEKEKAIDGAMIGIRACRAGYLGNRAYAGWLSEPP